MAPDGAQGWSGPMSPATFGPFWTLPWRPNIDQKSISGGEVDLRGGVFTVFSQFSVYVNILLRFWSIFEGPGPQKVMTLTGMSHFFNFLKNCKNDPKIDPK